jgi:hypothetical protein
VTPYLVTIALAVVAALGLWGVVAMRRKLRLAYEQGREDMRNDACNHLLRQMEAKRLDGDRYTAAALESAGSYIRNDTMNVLTEALRNQTRANAPEKRDEPQCLPQH